MTARVTRPLRVFVGPIEIAGYYTRLAQALRGAGVDAVAIDLSGNSYRYEGTEAPNVWVRLATATTRRLHDSRDRSLRRAWWRGAALATRLPMLVWAILRFDAFIFGFGETLLYGHELGLLRALGKRLVFAFNGSDARPPYVDGADMAASRAPSIDRCIELARWKKARIRRIERHAHAIVSQPAFSHFFERPVVDFFWIGVPRAASNPGTREYRPGEVVRILHSPSDPEVKGSDRIRATVAELRRAGHNLELIELRGVPNDVVRTEIERSDFVIDQLYSDAPMVGFATEAAAAGRPAIVGGYAWAHLDAFYPDTSMPPVQPCHPDHLAEAIVQLATDRDYRVSLGERARTFVNTTWASTAIAERYLTLIEGQVPAEWLFDPRTLRYVRGVGLSEERAREIVAGVLAAGGRAALQLGDKPAVEQAFVDFAEGR